MAPHRRGEVGRHEVASIRRGDDHNALRCRAISDRVTPPRSAPGKARLRLANPSQPSPLGGRAVRGNSGIAEAQLMFGVWALTAARVDGRGFFDGAEVAAFEQAAGDQIGEAEDRDVDAVA